MIKKPTEEKAGMREASATIVALPERFASGEDASAEATRLVELLFFAYRDFVGEPDRVLDRYGFGRAHHRVLHFVSRNPGLTVAELLDILGITKQSLARVLRDLLAGGFIQQRSGAQDRRQRLLSLTPTGKDLAGELLGLQKARVLRALSAVPAGSRAGVEHFLFGLIDGADKASGPVARLDPAKPAEGR